jgi:hypothetical protein
LCIKGEEVDASDLREYLDAGRCDSKRLGHNSEPHLYLTLFEFICKNVYHMNHAVCVNQSTLRQQHHITLHYIYRYHIPTLGSAENHYYLLTLLIANPQRQLKHISTILYQSYHHLLTFISVLKALVLLAKE